MRRYVLFLLPLVFLIILACNSTNSSPASKPMSAPATAPPRAAAEKMKTPAEKPLIGEHGFDVTGIDSTVAPCDDFYKYAVGKWREANPLPAQYSRFGRFEEVAKRNRDTLHQILVEDAAKTGSPHGSLEQKVGDFWASCMDEQAVEAEGIGPIRPELGRIDAVKSMADLRTELFHLVHEGYSPAFRISGQQDYKNSKMDIAVLSQSGLGLPDRDYYLRDDDRFKTIRDQYVAHITKMLTLVGEDPAQAADDAARILALEHGLASVSMSRVDTRSPEKTYNITLVSALDASVPNFDFGHNLPAIDVKVDSLNVEEPAYFAGVNKLLGDASLSDWKAYLRWKVVDSAAASLPKAFVDEDFAFGGVILSGQKEQLPRWERCVRGADFSIGQLLGQEYVKRRFTPEAKAKLNELIDNLVAALHADIPTLSWMSQPTKDAAAAKLSAFSRRIGYPDKWRDYSSLDIVRSSYGENVLNARRFFFRRGAEKIGKPDDRNDWGFFSPATVNASYQPSRNDITFPAGILQPPFYDPNADDAYNYGGIGTVIGHEMTHGFDDEGAKFDADGNLRDWWTPEDLKNFKARADCIATEYSEFNVAPGININGRLVTGEEIADLGGATLALAAYEKSLEGKPHPTIDGFSSEQRFFLGFAQVWGENMAMAEQTRRALTDPHAQGPFRVNGTVQNMPAFWKAFHCDKGTKMVREESKRCEIW